MQVCNSFRFLAVMTYACLAFSLQNAFSQTKAFEVLVVDRETGVPIKGVEIYSSERPLEHGKTDALGQLKLDLPDVPVDADRGSRGRLWVYHSQFQLQAIAIEALFRNQGVMTIRLDSTTPQKQTVHFGAKRIAGAVVRPIEFGFEIIPEPLQERMQATTDANGEVQISGFPGISTGSVEVRAKGLGVQILRVTGTPDRGIKSAPIGELRLRGVGKVRGKVTANDPKLLSGLTLRFESQSEDGVFGAAIGRAAVAKFAQDGSFEIPELASGKLILTELRDAPIPYRLRRPSPEAMHIAAGRTCTLSLPLERLVTLRGEVQFEDGTPVPDASVFYTSTQAAEIVHTDDAGRYELQVLPGECKLNVSGVWALEDRSEKGKLRRRKWEQKSEADLDELSIPNTTDAFKLPTITILKQRAVRGRLVDANEKPLPNETIFAYRTSADGTRRVFSSAMSDSEGKFELLICAAADSYEYVYDHEKQGVIENLAAKLVAPRPMEHPSANSREAALVKEGDTIILKSK